MATIQIEKTAGTGGSYVVRIDERRYSVVHDTADFRADYMIDSETARGPRTLHPRGPLAARIVAMVKEFERGGKYARIDVAKGVAVKMKTDGMIEKEQAWRLGYNSKIEAAKEPKAAAEPTAINEMRYAVGLDMNCDKVVVKVTLLHMTEPDEHGLDCVTMSDNIKVKDRAASLFLTEAEALASISNREPTRTQGAPTKTAKRLVPILPRADRANVSDSKLYAFGKVPAMDARDEDYVLTLTVHTADPEAEREIADYCTAAVNNRGQYMRALREAEKLLDSVAFVSAEGDTTQVLARIRAALAA